jgi:hypothetical protein
MGRRKLDAKELREMFSRETDNKPFPVMFYPDDYHAWLERQIDGMIPTGMLPDEPGRHRNIRVEDRETKTIREYEVRRVQ